MADKKEKVLVTGGSGFLGSHTADALSNAGYDVVIYDQQTSPFLRDDQTMIIGDILDADNLAKAMEGCSYIYHFAGIADIEEANDGLSKSAEINIVGTLKALELAKQAGVKRFLFASTVYVYSNSGGFYRCSKQACENFIESYESSHGLPYTILRYGSLYGRRAGEENGIYKLIRSGIEAGEIMYRGDKNARREYIHVQDAAKLSVQVLDDEYENRRLVLTGHEKMRVEDMMRMISEILPNKPEIVFRDQEAGDAHYVITPYNYTPKVGHKLVTNDHVDLGQGLLDCITEYFEDTNQEEDVIKLSAS